MAEVREGFLSEVGCTLDLQDMGHPQREERTFTTNSFAILDCSEHTPQS